jgi:hypothetical protein
MMPLSVMKTSAPPVGISRTGQDPQYPTPNDPIVVSIATSLPKSPQERVYLRWSKDWFITSHIIEATPGGDRLTYSATIPPQPAATTCFYTVLTSTADLNPLTTSGFIDELTLAVNGTFNALPAPPPTIIKQPSDAAVSEGLSAKFKVSASGDSPLSYQWRKNGTDIAGATKVFYTTPSTTPGDNGSLFSVRVTNNGGAIVSRDALLTVAPNNVPPTIATQPANKTVKVGRTARFSVTANGSIPLSYQWHKNGSDIPGAIKSTYKTPPTTIGDNGAHFSVTVSNSFGNILSNDAILTVH